MPPIPRLTEAEVLSNTDSGRLLDSGTVGKVIQFKLPGGETIKFCYCPPGHFTMGSPKTEQGRGTDEDQVSVRISKGFWMAQTPCTQGQWSALIASNPSNFKGNDLPVDYVSWEDAQGFISALNGAVSLPANWKAALPTEAQWEYACRAGTETVFHFGNELNGKQANCDGEYPYGTATKGPALMKTSAVASYAANPWGLYDMHGNLWQWCADWHDEKLPGGTDPRGSEKMAVNRVLRGGSWNDNPADCRAASRSAFVSQISRNNMGFRPALVSSR